ncbi:MAG: hypothetical protein DRQ44_16780 [Gammaproteobacteria bacterium]|nr:MAG: hypothetical protein DRQ44_16780 [Gammaproteobacteria bacterium]
MKNLFLLVAVLLTILTPRDMLANSILESFTITTHNVVVREFTESSIQLKSDNNSYFIKLEPNKSGRVVFGLTGIGYSSTAKISNLWFGVRITGYYQGETIQPIISLDDLNREIIIEQNTVKFQWISGSLPVVFDQRVDSVNLQFFNSYGLDVSQYLGIQDLRVLPLIEVSENPQLISCEYNNIMIGIDGSSSIDKRERAMIGNQLLSFVKKSDIQKDSSTLCIMEFGTNILAVDESAERDAQIKTVKRYKKRRNHRSKETSWTNWSAAFDEAILRQPDIFIFITDGWSNWDGQEPKSFSAQYEHLIEQCNTLKACGTRLVFVTSGMDNHSTSRSNLFPFLNGNLTMAVHEGLLYGDASLNDVDLIAMQEFSTLRQFKLSSILECPEEIAAVDGR